MHVKEKMLAADIRRSFDNTISLLKSSVQGFGYDDGSMFKLIFEQDLMIVVHNSR